MTLGNFNLINRFIIPVVYEEGICNNMDSSTGVKDITYQAFFSPTELGKFIWGVGDVDQAWQCVGDAQEHKAQVW